MPIRDFAVLVAASEVLHIPWCKQTGYINLLFAISANGCDIDCLKHDAPTPNVPAVITYA